MSNDDKRDNYFQLRAHIRAQKARPSFSVAKGVYDTVFRMALEGKENKSGEFVRTIAGEQITLKFNKKTRELDVILVPNKRLDLRGLVEFRFNEKKELYVTERSTWSKAINKNNIETNPWYQAKEITDYQNELEAYKEDRQRAKAKRTAELEKMVAEAGLREPVRITRHFGKAVSAPFAPKR